MSRRSSYSAEIAHMMLVFGAQPDQDSVRYTEEILRAQLRDVIAAAHDLAARRGSRVLETADLLFLYRDNKSLSARLRAMVSYRDVTRRQYNPDVDDPEEYDELISDALAVQRRPMRARGDAVSCFGQGLVDEADDQRTAAELDAARLREEDKLTRDLSLEDYRRFTEAREASFTWQKGRRFRIFLSLNEKGLDAPTLGEITDVLGFLAFELVRCVCQKGLAVPLPATAEKLKQHDKSQFLLPMKRKRTETERAATPAADIDASPGKRSREDTNASATSLSSPAAESAAAAAFTIAETSFLMVPDGPFASKRSSPPPQEAPAMSPNVSLPQTSSLARERLTASQIDEAYLALQSQQCRPKGEGLRKFHRGWSMRRTGFV